MKRSVKMPTTTTSTDTAAARVRDERRRRADGVTAGAVVFKAHGTPLVGVLYPPG
jgi:hypothetical protein